MFTCSSMHFAFFVKNGYQNSVVFVQIAQKFECEDTGIYALADECTPNVGQMYAKCRTNVRQMSPQYSIGKGSIGKDSIGKGSIYSADAAGEYTHAPHFVTKGR